MQPRQLKKFIRHHKEVKRQFQKSEEVGLTKIDELPEELQSLINDPFTRAVMEMDERIIMNTKERQRMISALNQLDSKIMHKVLEREVMARHGNQNLIMDQTDYD